MNNDFNINHFVYLLHGAAWTAGLSAVGFIGGGVLGLALALGRISPYRAIRWTLTTYIQLVQGTPLLILMFLSYFGLGVLGFNVPPLVAASLAMTIYAGAYLGEIWRGSLQAVPAEQWETAECLSFSSTQRMFQIIIPQAVRIATPPTVGFLVQIVKNSSLASVVGFVELARAGQVVNNTLFEPFLIFSLMALMYFALCYPLSRWSGSLERKLGRTRKVMVIEG
ncbi:MAG: amino acid ABC transporter permease [Polaromonas sp.]|uniref:amino acid ABC transporter permease n=1 Tax=Polaromonas sp. TaxID=1869339 RepID=UPI002488E900|nr:amino acid ABC transporter permease [Polaromonas sp.]MDI1269220.1 amino acid ABC transporter permease [Polaromonas sp.]